MKNPKAYLTDKLFQDDIEQGATRNGYGKGLVEAGEKNENVVALCADLTESTRTEEFAEKFPKRFVEIGVAEQNLATVGAGMALAGKIPFVSSYAAFSPGRNYEQIRTTIALNEANVKIVGAHAGVSVGPDGATHQMLEDIALMSALPHMIVLYPCDVEEARKATLAAAEMEGPVYLRFARANTPMFTTEKTPFTIGRAEVFAQAPPAGGDVTIVAAGPLVYEALLAAHSLKEKGIEVEVINSPSIKPLDEKTIIASVRKTEAVVTVEEHQVHGGLGGTVAELLAKNNPVPMEFIGVQDRFGESGEPAELLDAFGLSSPHIIKAVQKVLKRKKQT